MYLMLLFPLNTTISSDELGKELGHCPIVSLIWINI